MNQTTIYIIFIIGLIIGILIGLIVVGSINYKKIFLKIVKFLETVYDIPKPLIFSLYNVNNGDGFDLLLNKRPTTWLLSCVPLVSTILVLIIITLVFLFATDYVLDDDFVPIIYVCSIISYPFGFWVTKVKIKNMMTSERFYTTIPLSFRYSKITFEGHQHDVSKIENYLIHVYKQVKFFYNPLMFKVFSIKSNFNYYFLYLRTIGCLLKSKKIIDFFKKNKNIEIVIDNRKVDFNEFKQVLLNNLFCIFYYFNFYGCRSNFLNDLKKFENSEITKKGHKFNEIKDNDFLRNDSNEDCEDK